MIFIYGETNVPHTCLEKHVSFIFTQSARRSFSFKLHTLQVYVTPSPKNEKFSLYSIPFRAFFSCELCAGLCFVLSIFQVDDFVSPICGSRCWRWRPQARSSPKANKYSQLVIERYTKLPSYGFIGVCYPSLLKKHFL